MTLLETMVSRWNDPAARPPFKGQLIDENGCCCAQGDVLRACGWSDNRLRSAEQAVADYEVAMALGISVTHSVLLRQVNDSQAGCPQDVLTRPERILGDQAPRVLAFWRRLDMLTAEEWTAVGAAAAVKAAAITRAIAGADTFKTIAWNATWAVAWRAAGFAARDTAARNAAWATNEIQGAAKLDKFFFLPLFGIADPLKLDTKGG